MTLSRRPGGKGFFMVNIADPDNFPKRNTRFAFIPRPLQIAGRPELSLFPFNIMFMSHKLEHGNLISGTVIYEPDLATFMRKDRMMVMRYDNVYGGSWVIIEYDTGNNYYMGTKYIKGVESGMATGMDWKMFFVHLTAIGVVNFERCKMEVVPRDMSN